MTLRRKLFVAFTLVLLLLTVQGSVALFLLTRFLEETADLVGPALSRVDKLAHTDSDLMRLRSLEHSLIMATSAEERQRLTVELSEIRVRVLLRLQDYRRLDLDQQRAEAAKDIHTLLLGYLASQSAVMEAVDAGRGPWALQEYLSFGAQFQDMGDRVHSLRHQEYSATEAMRDQMVQVATQMRWPLAATMGLVAVSQLGLGLYISRRIGQSLGLLQDGAQRIAREDFSIAIPQPPERDLARLADTLNFMMKALASSNADKARLEEERLRLVRERLRRVVRAQEEERGRVSRELHDQAGQLLTALQYGLTRARKLAQDPPLEEEIDGLLTLVADTGGRLRSLARDLRPAVLDDLGLVPALRAYTREFSERIGIPIQLSAMGPVPRMPSDSETTVFRVVQEALTNIGKHARAHHAWVTLHVEDGHLEVRVRDDGCGFDPASLGHSPAPGLGLAGIEERVRLLGGEFHIQSGAETGTHLFVTFLVNSSGEASL